jgi:predicted small integral membrane protein
VIELRLAKVTMVASLALFALLVTFNNITDYGVNFAFVRHVLSMDTVPSGNQLAWRAIATPALWHAAYCLIIVCEGLTGIAFSVGAVEMIASINANAAVFNRSKRFAFIGAATGFLIWFFGFMVVGGEWFGMWQSPVWNGQAAAFRFYMAMLGVAIFVAQDEHD